MLGIRSLLAVLAATIAFHGGAALAHWKPERAVEIIAPSGPGGTTDRTARVVAGILTKYKLVDVPVNVVNKPGGSGTIGLTYLNQHPGDGHYMIVATTGSISNNIIGLIPYNHTAFSPLAMLFEEYLAVTVRADSPIKSGRDLVDMLRKNPQAASFGISTSLGGANHTTLLTCPRSPRPTTRSALRRWPPARMCIAPFTATTTSIPVPETGCWSKAVPIH